MSIELSSDLVAYHAFVKSMLSKGGSIDEDATPAAFLEYQDQLNRLREALQPAATRFRRAEGSSKIDIDQLVEEVLRDASHNSEEQ